MTAAACRVWRLRKRHQSIDAALTVEDSDGAHSSDAAGRGAAGGPGRDGSGGSGVVLQFLLSGEVVYTRRWPTRALALEDATVRRSELEREGWMPHW